MGRGTWLQMVITGAVIVGLQMTSLALTCTEHWALVHHYYHLISFQSSDRAPHPHGDGSPHNHEQCSIQGMPTSSVLVLPALDCFCSASGSLAFLSVQPGARALLGDDPLYEQISLKLLAKPPIG